MLLHEDMSIIESICIAIYLLIYSSPELSRFLLSSSVGCMQLNWQTFICTTFHRTLQVLQLQFIAFLTETFTFHHPLVVYNRCVLAPIR